MMFLNHHRLVAEVQARFYLRRMQLTARSNSNRSLWFLYHSPVQIEKFKIQKQFGCKTARINVEIVIIVHCTMIIPEQFDQKVSRGQRCRLDHRFEYGLYKLHARTAHPIH